MREGWRDGFGIRREDGYWFTDVAGRDGWSPALDHAVVFERREEAEERLATLHPGASYEIRPLTTDDE